MGPRGRLIPFSAIILAALLAVAAAADLPARFSAKVIGITDGDTITAIDQRDSHPGEGSNPFCSTYFPLPFRRPIRCFKHST